MHESHRKPTARPDVLGPTHRRTIAARPDGSDPIAFLLRLAVGGTIEGVDQVAARLQHLARAEAPLAGRAPATEALSTARVGYALIGIVVDVYARARQGAGTATRAVTAVGRFWGGVFSMLSWPLRRPLRVPYEILLERGLPELDHWARIGEAEVERGRGMARTLACSPIDDVVTYLQRNPALEQLVQKHAAALLDELAEDPQVAALVRAQADRYVDHLRQNPEPIQELLQEHTSGLAEQVADAVRARAVTGDELLEQQIRRILGRGPRPPAPGAPPDPRAPAGSSRSAVDD